MLYTIKIDKKEDIEVIRSATKRLKLLVISEEEEDQALLKMMKDEKEKSLSQSENKKLIDKIKSSLKKCHLKNGNRV